MSECTLSASRRPQPDRRASTLVVVALAGVLGAFFLGMMVGWGGARRASLEDLERVSASLAGQRELLDAVRRAADAQVGTLAAEVGRMRTHLVRVDALGRHLLDLAGLDRGEFDFAATPATAGVCRATGKDDAARTVPSLDALLASTDATIADRSRQLEALATLIRSRTLMSHMRPSIRPVAAARVSSRFGERIDPFSGESGFHDGIDFAGRAGTRVLAAADGIVSHAGRSSTYGLVVELTHGAGFVTRYAHNSSVFVQPGQTIRRGEPIALVGSNGRSTGPHLHFEVLLAGDPVNPLSLIER